MRTAVPPRPEVRPWNGWVAPIVLAALPWAWFLVRDFGPAMNVLAFWLPPAAVGLALVVLAFSVLAARMPLAVVSLSLVVFTAVVVLAPRTTQPDTAPLQPFRLVSANTYDGNLQPEAAVGALVAERPDVLVAVETSREVLADLRVEFADRSLARFAGLNVFSRWPVRLLGAIPSVPETTAMRVQVLRPGAPFILYAMHLSNPLHDVSFSQHAHTVARLLRGAESETLPVVLAGDFNMTDRTTSYRLLDGVLRDAMRASLAGSTYERWLWALFQLRIDHVFTAPRWCSQDAFTFSVPGSDHEGLSAELGRCP